jgi:RNA-directed DNA polymerase
LLKKVKTIIHDNLAVDQQLLIGLLNPVIRGWANYHRHIVSSKVFAYIDHEIWRKLWRWCCRRHPEKGRKWIKNRYFHRIKGRDWTFASPEAKQSTERIPRGAILILSGNTPVRRHTKIKSAANPFDPEWEGYFQQRTGNKMLSSLSGRRTLRSVWLNQRRVCPVCTQQITEESGWVTHYLVKATEGGRPVCENLIMLHPSCNEIARCSGLKVMKPAPARGL